MYTWVVWFVVFGVTALEDNISVYIGPCIHGVGGGGGGGGGGIESVSVIFGCQSTVIQV